jgi:hypothetical protein
MMADLVSHFEGVHTSFLWKFLILSHFLNLKTPTDDFRLRHCLGFETPFLYRAAVTGLVTSKNLFNFHKKRHVEENSYKFCHTVRNFLPWWKKSFTFLHGGCTIEICFYSVDGLTDRQTKYALIFLANWINFNEI